MYKDFELIHHITFNTLYLFFLCFSSKGVRQIAKNLPGINGKPYVIIDTALNENFWDINTSYDL